MAVGRIAISLPAEQLARLEKFVREKAYASRSKAVADILRAHFMKEEWNAGRAGSAAIVFLFNHRSPSILHPLTHVQHNFADVIISTTHAHIEKERCIEVILAKGKPSRIRALADALQRLRGIELVRLAAL
ncbi:MAG: nickel-responsive transcriptional regulator NikR [Candidatus Micrarchaeia archaeon]